MSRNIPTEHVNIMFVNMHNNYASMLMIFHNVFKYYTVLYYIVHANFIFNNFPKVKKIQVIMIFQMCDVLAKW